MWIGMCYSLYTRFLNVLCTFSLRPVSTGIVVILNIYLSIYLSIYLAIYFSVCLSVCLSIYLSIYVSIYLAIYLSTYLSIYYLSTYLFDAVSDVYLMSRFSFHFLKFIEIMLFIIIMQVLAFYI